MNALCNIFAATAQGRDKWDDSNDFQSARGRRKFRKLGIRMCIYIIVLVKKVTSYLLCQFVVTPKKFYLFTFKYEGCAVA